MFSVARRGEFRYGILKLNKRLLLSLLLATEVIEIIASDICEPEVLYRKSTELTYTMSCQNCVDVCDTTTKTAITALKSWLQAHEEAQVMLASVLVVVGVWWLVRTFLALLINLVCPVIVVLLAVLCVPQLRAPLLGQNYPAVANLMRNILLKLAENIKS
ncbi:uncharacterized protein LOC116779054 isoform X2 [Danaus plexippus]|uniref:uncharacterized protein LOC116779054 isoform X2 n=1 Tax=Danaus plexippus TaxID=13037 RepID=UPI0013C44631|nr:uncharacterized protein LOC116779054 isoform X2 [Danaus plexippus]